MAKKQIITKRKIASTLRESVFTPITPGPLKVIIDVGDIDYYIKRTIELCTVALTGEYQTTKSRMAALTQAISLLAVGKILIIHNSVEAIKELREGK